MPQIRKPQITDIDPIKALLVQWNDLHYVEKYLPFIENYCNDKELGLYMEFFVLEDNNKIVGFAALSDINETVKELVQTSNPIELKMLYLDNAERGKGYGKLLLSYLENLVKERRKGEMIIRSSDQFKETAWEFYKKMGFPQIALFPATPEKTETAVFHKVYFKPLALKPEISFSDLEKVDIRIGTILSVSDVDGSDKLVELVVDFGTFTRHILVGMKKERKDCTEVIGKQALFVVNLAPRKMAGRMSEGMIFDIGYSNEVLPVLAMPEITVPNGTNAG